MTVRSGQCNTTGGCGSAGMFEGLLPRGEPRTHLIQASSILGLPRVDPGGGRMGQSGFEIVYRTISATTLLELRTLKPM